MNLNWSHGQGHFDVNSISSEDQASHLFFFLELFRSCPKRFFFLLHLPYASQPAGCGKLHILLPDSLCWVHFLPAHSVLLFSRVTAWSGLAVASTGRKFMAVQAEVAAPLRIAWLLIIQPCYTTLPSQFHCLDLVVISSLSLHVVIFCCCLSQGCAALWDMEVLWYPWETPYIFWNFPRSKGEPTEAGSQSKHKGISFLLTPCSICFTWIEVTDS